MCTVRECADGGGIPTAGDMNHPKTWCDGGSHRGENIDLAVHLDPKDVAAVNRQIIKELSTAVHKSGSAKR